MVLHSVPSRRRSEPPVATRADELLALATAAGRGEPEALRTFVVTIVPRLLRVVRRVLGAGHPDEEDVTYQAAHAVLDALPRFRGEGTVLHFACRVAVLTAMNVRRRDAAEKRSRGGETEDPELLQGNEPSPEQSVSQARLAGVVRDLVAELSEPLAEALTLHVILGYTVAEIARATEVPIETVRSRLRLAKQALSKRVLASRVLQEIVEVEP